MLEDNRRQDVLIEELNTRMVYCDVAEDIALITEESKSSLQFNIFQLSTQKALSTEFELDIFMSKTQIKKNFFVLLTFLTF